MTDRLTGSAIIPLSTRPASADPWHLLATGGGVLVSWEPFSGRAVPWGPPVAATSQLARNLNDIISQTGAARLATETLFRVEVPAGQTIRDLLPAVGGGYRGITTAGSSKFASQARLIPVKAGGAAVGVALGPLVGLMALSVASEMVARQQMEAKLDAIQRSVERIEADSLNEKFALLRTGQQALELGTAALLDRIAIPESVGLGSAVHGIRVVRNMSVDWIAKWEKVGAELAGEGADHARIEQAIGGIGIGGAPAFPAQAGLAYQALALDSRAHILSTVEAAATHPDGSFDEFRRRVSDGLAANAAEQARLVSALWALAEIPIRARMVHGPGTGSREAMLRQTFLRLTRALSQSTQSPPVLTDRGAMQIAAVRSQDGSVRILEPGV